MNRDQIKFLAIITMTCNHIANIFLTPGTLLFEIMIDIGYFTAITMCYFLVEGYGYTHDKKKYGERLLLFGVISFIPFCLAFGMVQMNMLCTLFLCFLILKVMEMSTLKWEKWIVILILIFVSLYSDWALLAPVFTILFHKLCHLLSHGAQYQKLLSRNPVSQIKEPLILSLLPGSHHHKLKNPLS